MTIWRSLLSNPAPATRWKLQSDASEDLVHTDDGADLIVYSKGQGRTVVLLHGQGGSASHFSFLFKRLSTKNLRVVAVDLRGHGQASKTRLCSAKMLASDIQKVLDHLTGEDFTLVGYGMGGYAALAWRIFSPAARTGVVKGFVLISSFSKRPANWTYRFFQFLMASCFLHVILRIKFLSHKFSRALFGHACTPSMQEEWRRSLLACDPSIWEQFDQVTFQDLTPFLRFIGEPALVICGNRDVMCYDSQAALGTLGHDGGQEPLKEVLDRMGHVLLWEAPDRITALIYDFMTAQQEKNEKLKKHD